MVFATESCDVFFFCWDEVEGRGVSSFAVEAAFAWSSDDAAEVPILSRVKGVEGCDSLSCVLFSSGATSLSEKEVSRVSSSSSSIK